MSELHELDPTTLLPRIPDEPRWIDLRALLLGGRCRVLAEEGSEGFVACPEWYPFVSVWGDPGAAAIAAAVAGAGRPVEVLVGEEGVRSALSALTGWRYETVHFHRWEGPGGLVGEAAWATHLDPAAPPDLSHLPAELGREHREMLAEGRPMAAVLTDAAGVPRTAEEVAVSELSRLRPVAFCYATCETETLWDVSVDTLASHRRRGLAAACFERVRREMADRGKLPVWGAHDSNAASLGLAGRLGFRRVAELLACRRPSSQR